jgi:hypothetical protein
MSATAEMRASRGSCGVRALGRIDTAFRAGLARACVGREGGDLLGIPDDLWRFAILGVFPAVRALELARRVTPFGTRLAERLGERAVQRYLEQALGGTPPSYLPYAMRDGEAAAQPRSTRSNSRSA